MTKKQNLSPIILILLLFLAGCGELNKDTGNYIDVGGHKLYYETYGAGSPTIIFENGSACELSDWRLVAPEIAKTNKVFLYDRAGLGKSELGPTPRNASIRYAELNTLLTKANISPPYIIVSHSLGCILARNFQHFRPTDVLAMVLVDPGHESMLTRAGTPFATALWDSIVVGSKTMSAGISAEAFGAFDTWAEVEAESLESVGNIPLEVIVSTKTMGLVTDEALNNIGNRALRDLQIELVGQSPQGILSTAEGSGHFVQLEQPQTVIDAVKRAINKIR